jgi:Rieske Fe-S protein
MELVRHSIVIFWYNSTLSNCISFLLEKDKDVNRRSALTLIIGAISGAWALLTASVTGLFVTSPLRENRMETAMRLGEVDAFDATFRMVQLEVDRSDGWFKKIDLEKLYVRVDDAGQPQVMSATCTHLGCSVNWEEESEHFVCPCHGGQFSAEGVVLGGPPPGPLHPVKSVVKNNLIVVYIA